MTPAEQDEEYAAFRSALIADFSKRSVGWLADELARTIIQQEIWDDDHKDQTFSMLTERLTLTRQWSANLQEAVTAAKAAAEANQKESSRAFGSTGGKAAAANREDQNNDLMMKVQGLRDVNPGLKTSDVARRLSEKGEGEFEALRKKIRRLEKAPKKLAT